MKIQAAIFDMDGLVPDLRIKNDPAFATADLILETLEDFTIDLIPSP